MNFQELIKKDDGVLVDLVKSQNDSVALEILASRHKGIVTNVMHGFGRNARISGSLMDDLLSDVTLVVYNAAKKYDTSRCRTKFSTYLWDASRFHTFNFLRKEAKYWHGKDVQSEEVLSKQKTDTSAREKEESESEQMRFVLEALRDCPDERIKDIFRLRYLNGTDTKMTYSKIAKRINMSHQGVFFLHERFIADCKKQLANKKRVDK